MPDSSRIQLGELRVEVLEERHLELLKRFEADVKELKDFLVEDAYNNQQWAISTTYLWFYNPTNDLVAYMTVLNDAIRVHGTQLGKQFVDMGVNYKTLPAMKIGRMCVDNKYLKRGIGTYLTEYAMHLVLRNIEISGCRFLVLDAKTQTGAQHFYKKRGFQVLKQREKGTIPMFYDMIKIIEYYRGNKKNLVKFNSKA